jgi:ADP-heptose:LPS heptosyltransferase
VADLIFGASVTATILVSVIAGRGFRLGVGKMGYARFFDRTVEYERNKHHIIKGTGSVLNLFGIELKDCDLKPHIYLEEKDLVIGREFVSELRQKHQRVVVINLSAGRPARTWPLEKYHRLIEMLLNEYPEWVFVLSSAPSDYFKAEQLQAHFPSRVVAIPRGLSIRQVAGLLCQIDYLITPDTSFVHLASAFDPPALVMFTGDDGHFREWGPYNPRIRAVLSPDFYRIEQIEPQTMLEAFQKMIQSEERGA